MCMNGSIYVGMDDSPHMMYAVNCQEGIAEKIPSIIHVDGTCLIPNSDTRTEFITMIL